MGISGNAAAQLIFRARAKLREALNAGAVASVVASSEECETAQLLLSKVQDGEPVDEADRLWLEEHLEECGSCRAARGMLLEVGASYRGWLPVGLLAGMRTDTLTRAGELVGADWSHVTPRGHAGRSLAGGAVAAVAAAAVAAAAVAVIAAAGIAFLALTRDDDVGQVASRGQQPAADAPSVSARSAPAPGDAAKSGFAEPSAELAAARALRAAGAPVPANPPIRISARSDGPAAPVTPRVPLLRPVGPENGAPSPPGSGPGPRTPNPSEPRDDPPVTPAPTPVDPAPPGSGPPALVPPVDTKPPVDTTPPVARPGTVEFRPVGPLSGTL